MEIGSEQVSSSRTSYFNGKIDNLHIYDVALTPEQISQIYSDGGNDGASSTIVPVTIISAPALSKALTTSVFPF